MFGFPAEYNAYVRPKKPSSGSSEIVSRSSWSNDLINFEFSIQHSLPSNIPLEKDQEKNDNKAKRKQLCVFCFFGETTYTREGVPLGMFFFGRRLSPVASAHTWRLSLLCTTIPHVG